MELAHEMVAAVASIPKSLVENLSRKEVIIRTTKSLCEMANEPKES